MTWNAGVRAGSLRSALSSAGSYQAPRYHIKTMLRARYFASTSYGVLFLSPSSNRNASMIAWSRLDALRFIRTSLSRYSSPDGNFSLAHVKYSRFTSTGSEPGTDFAKSTGGAGTVGGFVGGGASLKPGASLSAGIPVSALESNTKSTMCSREFGSTLWACAGVSSVAPTVAAAVTAAAPVSTVRRVNAPPGSSSNASGAIELRGGSAVLMGSPLVPRFFKHESEVRLVEKVLGLHSRRAHLLAHCVAVTGHA